MNKKTIIISVIIIVLILAAAVFLGRYYFSWQQAREICFGLNQQKFEAACDSLKNIESEADKCVKNNDFNCIDLLNYKFFYYLLVKKETSQTTNKICQEVFLSAKNDAPTPIFQNQETFCADFSKTLIERNEQNCTTLFGDEFSQNYCRFLLTADKQYCLGDQEKCANRAILFQSFLDGEFDTCDQITDFNTRAACVFFQNFVQNENFSCKGALGNKDDFLGGELGKTLCQGLN